MKENFLAFHPVVLTGLIGTCQEDTKTYYFIVYIKRVRYEKIFLLWNSKLRSHNFHDKTIE